MSSISQELVPEGFQKTEIGVIPVGWDVKQLYDFIVALEAGISVNSTNDSEASSHGMSILKTSCIFGGKFFPKEAKAILSRDLKRAKLNPRKNAIIISRMNTPALVGEIGFVDNDCCDLFLPDRLWQTKYKNESAFHERWLAYILSYPTYSNKVKETATGTSNSMKNISKDSFLSVKVPTPNKSEQIAISTALSDVDTLITSLEKLIAKKRAIKTAAMQQLLTGKKRLPPFDQSHTGYKKTELGEIPEDWELVRLGDLGKTYGGLTGKTKSDFGIGNANYIPFMNIMSSVTVNPKWVERVSLKVGELQNEVLKGDLLFNGSSETPEEVAMCSLVLNQISDLYLNSFCFGFRLNKDTNSDGLFMAYWFRSSIGRNMMAYLAQGATRYNISKRAFVELQFWLPSVEEQKCISAILSDMDLDIQSLEQRLNKAQKIKQGMMQELLTGKTRLL